MGATWSPRHSTKQNEDLIRKSTSKEIKEDAVVINTDKAPKPDGFSASFFQFI